MLKFHLIVLESGKRLIIGNVEAPSYSLEEASMPRTRKNYIQRGTERDGT